MKGSEGLIGGSSRMVGENPSLPDESVSALYFAKHGRPAPSGSAKGKTQQTASKKAPKTSPHPPPPGVYLNGNGPQRLAPAALSLMFRPHRNIPILPIEQRLYFARHVAEMAREDEAGVDAARKETRAKRLAAADARRQRVAEAERVRRQKGATNSQRPGPSRPTTARVMQSRRGPGPGGEDGDSGCEEDEIARVNIPAEVVGAHSRDSMLDLSRFHRRPQSDVERQDPMSVIFGEDGTVRGYKPLARRRDRVLGAYVDPRDGTLQVTGVKRERFRTAPLTAPVTSTRVARDKHLEEGVEKLWVEAWEALEDHSAYATSADLAVVGGDEAAAWRSLAAQDVSYQREAAHPPARSLHDGYKESRRVQFALPAKRAKERSEREVGQSDSRGASEQSGLLHPPLTPMKTEATDNEGERPAGLPPRSARLAESVGVGINRKEVLPEVERERRAADARVAAFGKKLTPEALAQVPYVPSVDESNAANPSITSSPRVLEVLRSVSQLAHNRADQRKGTDSPPPSPKGARTRGEPAAAPNSMPVELRGGAPGWLVRAFGEGRAVVVNEGASGTHMRSAGGAGTKLGMHESRRLLLRNTRVMDGDYVVAPEEYWSNIKPKRPMTATEEAHYYMVSRGLANPKTETAEALWLQHRRASSRWRMEGEEELPDDVDFALASPVFYSAFRGDRAFHRRHHRKKAFPALTASAPSSASDVPFRVAQAAARFARPLKSPSSDNATPTVPSRPMRPKTHRGSPGRRSSIIRKVSGRPSTADHPRSSRLAGLRAGRVRKGGVSGLDPGPNEAAVVDALHAAFHRTEATGPLEARLESVQRVAESEMERIRAEHEASRIAAAKADASKLAEAAATDVLAMPHRSRRRHSVASPRRSVHGRAPSPPKSPPSRRHARSIESRESPRSARRRPSFARPSERWQGTPTGEPHTPRGRPATERKPARRASVGMRSPSGSPIARDPEGTVHTLSAVSRRHGFLADMDVSRLEEETAYSRSELFSMFATFKSLCSLALHPSGVDAATFRKAVPMLALEDSHFVNKVFQHLDTDASGTIEWPEFIRAMAALDTRDSRVQASFVFNVYDGDGDGRVNRDELAEFLKHSIMVNGDEGELERVCQGFADQVFRTLEIPSTRSYLTKKDVMTYIQVDPAHRDIMSLFGRSTLGSMT